MKTLRDILLGIILGALIVIGTLFVMPNAVEVYTGFFDNVKENIVDWANGNSELLQNTNFTSLFSSGEEVQQNAIQDSGITGESHSFSETMNPYYTMLDEDEQSLYKQMYANANARENSFKPVVNLNAEQVEKVFQCVFYDHPELFWLDNGYSYKYVQGGDIVEIDLKYNATIDDYENAKAQFDAVINQIVLEAQMYGTQLEQEEYVHDTLVQMISYDLEAPLNQSAYSAIVNQSTVCAGYAKAFQVIMKELNIPTYYVVGTSENQQHAWCIIYIDGKFQNVDVTWDDTSNQLRRFFNVSDAMLSQTHTRTDLSIYLPECF